VTFVFGGSLAPARARSRTYPAGPLAFAGPVAGGEVLVLGGATAGLLDSLTGVGARATVVEAPQDVDDLKGWAGGHTVMAFSAGLVVELPRGAFGAVLLPGGTVHTGGPFWPGDDWAARRCERLAVLAGLVRPGGAIVLDAVQVRDNLVRCVALGQDADSAHLVEASVSAVDGGHVLVVRASDHDLQGRCVRRDTVACPWAPLADGDLAAVEAAVPGAVIAWGES
jgi:hypothetical protein